MRSTKGTRPTASAGKMWLFPTLLVCLGACDTGGVVEPLVAPSEARLDNGRSGASAHFTGSVDLVWPGGKGAGAPDDDRIAQAKITAFLGVPEGTPGPGDFTYRVVSADGLLLHREIGVKLIWAGLEDQAVLLDGQEVPLEGDIRFIGVVVSDTKPCGGSGHGSGGGCGEDEGGCSDDDGGCSDDEGGCSHDDGTTHDDGGCSDDDTTHDDGGCSHDDDGTTHDDGGCSGSDGGGGSGGHGEPGGPGGPDGKVTGQDCRIGQVVIGWMLDGGTPARRGDRVSWKWMAPDAQKVLDIQAAIAEIESGADPDALIPWPCKLCEKEILGGNLTLHLPKK